MCIDYDEHSRVMKSLGIEPTEKEKWEREKKLLG